MWFLSPILPLLLRRISTQKLLKHSGKGNVEEVDSVLPQNCPSSLPTASAADVEKCVPLSDFTLLHYISELSDDGECHAIDDSAAYYVVQLFFLNCFLERSHKTAVVSDC